MLTHSLQRILVASDLTEQANIAIDRAIELACEHQSELIVLHIIDEELPPYVKNYLMTATDRSIRSALARKPHSAEVTITIDIVVGRPDLDIAERAEIEEADLIVVGLHDRILEENLKVQDTIVDQVIQETSLPVLVVKNQPREPYSSVVVGVDFSDISQEAARSAAVVAPNATLHLVHACQDLVSDSSQLNDAGPSSSSIAEHAAQPKSSTMSKMTSFGERAVAGIDRKPSLHHVLEGGETHTVLKAQISNSDADLVSIGTHGRTGIARSLLGSVATDILNDRLVDVLVVRAH